MILQLDASDGVYDELNNVLFQLPRPLNAPDGYSLRLTVLSFALPHTHFPINQYNNELTINGTTGVVEAGNYSAWTLSKLLDSQWPGLTVEFNEITERITFSASNSFTIAGSMCAILDIPEGTEGTSVSSVKCVNMSTTQHVYVTTDRHTDSISSAGRKGIVCCVPVQVPAGGIIRFSDPNATQAVVLGDRGVSSLRIQLFDGSWNGFLAAVPWSLVVRVDFEYTGVRDAHRPRPTSLTVPYT